MKQNIQDLPGGLPPRDEEWWSALLAEEEKIGGDFLQEPFLPGEQKKGSRLTTINWELARNIYLQDETVTLQVTGYNRGGLLVEGSELQGFVPISHLIELPAEQDEAREKLLVDYVKKDVLLKVIECDPERGRVVFSERAALSGPGRRNQLLSSLNAGERVRGTVTNITDFGVFVDLGGVEGLIHVSELSWGRVRHPGETLTLAERVEVYVISVDGERSRVALSMKRLHPNPWETAEQRYFPGQIVEATITSILPFGAFARLEEGLDGLIHISEMGGDNESLKPADVLTEGQKINVRVLQVDAQKQRLGLSLRVGQQEDW